MKTHILQQIQQIAALARQEATVMVHYVFQTGAQQRRGVSLLQSVRKLFKLQIKTSEGVLICLQWA